MFKKLPLSFYRTSDTEKIALDLLGKYLITNIGNQLTGGMILETESYLGKEDRASHSFGGRYTERTKVMYLSGGVSYIYLCYGIHYLFNIITHLEGEPHAILIRAIKPEIGIETILKRRGSDVLTSKLTSGPGTVTQALGINKTHNGLEMTSDTIWVEDRGIAFKNKEIEITSRIGVGYAKEWAKKPLRFLVKSASIPS